MAKQESVPYLTRWFTARFPKISKPDTKGQFADGKFKTDGVFLSADDLKETKNELLEIAKGFWPKVDPSELQIPIVDFFANKDDRKAKKVEASGIRLKSKYRSAVFDAKRKKLPESVEIGGGSIIRVAAFAVPWNKTTKVKIKGVETEVEEHGIGLRLGDIQVRKLVERHASGDGSAFDEDEEGYTYEGAEDDAEGASQFGDATDL